MEWAIVILIVAASLVLLASRAWAAVVHEPERPTCAGCSGCDLSAVRGAGSGRSGASETCGSQGTRTG